MEAHQSAREKFLQLAKEQEEEERLAKLRLLQDRRKAAQSKHKKEETLSAKDILDKKKREEKKMDHLEQTSGQKGVWVRDEFKQQAMCDRPDAEAGKELERQKEKARQIAEEESRFQAEQEARHAEAENRREAVAAAQKRLMQLQEEQSKKSSKKPRFVVAAHSDDGAGAEKASDSVVAQAKASSENSVPSAGKSIDAQRNVAEVPSKNSAIASVPISATKSSLDNMIRKARGKLLGIEVEDGPAQDSCLNQVLGGYDSDSSESAESE